MLGKINISIIMKKCIVAILCLLITSNILSQKTLFFNYFKSIELPFRTDISSFDICASENNIKLSESDIEKYLLLDADEFLIRKYNQALERNSYYDFFPVGKIIMKSHLMILYYRSYKTVSNDFYAELMACIFDVKSNLCQTLSLSKMDTQLGIFTFCVISENGDISIRYYSKKAIDNENLETGVIKEIKYKLTNGNIPYQNVLTN